jgi:single-stranded-DNA-specific exonuclease
MRVIKEKHICLPLGKTTDGRPLSAMGWSRPGRSTWTERVAGVPMGVGARVDLVFRLRENTHPQYGGLELELVDLSIAANIPNSERP